ncbi:MAG TPA: hypothetical protein VM238_22915 [Phycisphaerae bacterium]|nr:hypothetical protein [Phycisphaerae bacterium]
MNDPTAKPRKPGFIARRLHYWGLRSMDGYKPPGGFWANLIDPDYWPLLVFFGLGSISALCFGEVSVGPWVLGVIAGYLLGCKDRGL